VNIELGLKVIQEVAMEHGYHLTDGEYSFEIFKSTLRPKYFKIKKKDEDLLVYQWEDTKNDYSTNALYTLRNMNDVIKYCNILNISNDIRSGRNK
jgi:hypothetical protein